MRMRWQRSISVKSFSDVPRDDERVHQVSELRRSRLSFAFVSAYRWKFLRRWCLAIVRRLEGGDFYSATLREILQKYHGVRVGAYSYGEGLIPGAFPSGVIVGRYVSMAPAIKIYLRNHPMDRLSMHPFFYNSKLGWLVEDSISFGTLEIGHDAWLGERAMITPGCSRIGIGAVIAAGAVVTKDVPDFAIVGGNPARIIRMRFAPEVCKTIRMSEWWTRSAEECARFMPAMIKSLEDGCSRHPLFAAATQGHI
jgi:virginiamycin A acetyltransferase